MDKLEPARTSIGTVELVSVVLLVPVEVAEARVEFGRKWVEAMYRHGNVAAAMEAMYWSHPRCRVGVFPCEELDSKVVSKFSRSAFIAAICAGVFSQPAPP